MKLNYKRTIKIGLAFAIIMLFWTAYDFVIPLLLERAFGLSNSVRGVVMGIDNILSLFLLPIFGKWSDTINTKRGRRTPFVLIGTICSVVIMIFVPITAHRQLEEAGQLRAQIYLVETDADFTYTSANGTTYHSAREFYEMMYTKKKGLSYPYSDHDYLALNGKDSLEAYLEVANCGVKELSRRNGKYYVTVIENKEIEINEKTYLHLSSDTLATPYRRMLLCEMQDIYSDAGKYYATILYDEKVEITEEEYKTYRAQNEAYQKYVEPGVAIFASEEVNTKVTKVHPERLALYLAILFLVLVAMASFRSPAVALMPDVTPKPLRSQANAIINLMGGIGGALAFAIYTVGFLIADNPFMQIFAVCAAVMVALLVAFLLLVKEPEFVEQCKRECEEYGISNDDEAQEIEHRHHEDQNAENNPENEPEETVTPEELERRRKKHERDYKRSFFFILASTFMWFMGYNAISSNLSVYCTKILNQTTAVASVISGLSMGISAIAFIPVGLLAVKIGRRKSVLLGFLLAIISFGLIFFFVKPDNMARYLFAVFYVIAGFGLIITNVNTFPMVLELSSSSSVGKYTGYYYIATMSAQAITPFLSGLVMDYFDDKYLFLYSAICVVVAFIFMFFTRYGDSKPVPAGSTLEYLGADND